MTKIISEFKIINFIKKQHTENIKICFKSIYIINIPVAQAGFKQNKWLDNFTWEKSIDSCKDLSYDIFNNNKKEACMTDSFRKKHY